MATECESKKAAELMTEPRMEVVYSERSEKSRRGVTMENTKKRT